MSNPFFHSSLVIPTGGDVAADDSLCPGDLPLVLLPVRLETRFVATAPAGTELLVRVYPDAIHLDSHEPGLTSDEQDWGRHYWQSDWRAGDLAAQRLAAWRQLADRFGAARAGWIARATRPTNQAQRPAAPTPDGASPSPAPVFPALGVETSGEGWRSPARARLLPDRWTAVLHAGGQVALRVTGRDIRRPLAVGPDPRAALTDPAARAAVERGEQVAIDPGMAWMVDFQVAEALGMALRIPLPAELLQAGIDSLLVLGVAGGDGHDQLADLLDAHRHTEGLAFLQPGFATNNTEERRSGYDSADPGHRRSFAHEIAAPVPAADANAVRVGRALGLDGARAADTLGHIDRGTDRDERAARAMATALWPVGWGYFLGHLIGAEAGVTDADLSWARRHFLDQVRALGPLPALRCGAQPYGLLAVSSLDLWQADPSAADAPREGELRTLLATLRDRIWRPAAAHAARIGARGPQDPDADLLDLMRGDGVSAGYRGRNVFGPELLRHLFDFMSVGAPKGEATRPPDGGPAQRALLDSLGLAWTPRLMRFASADWTRRVRAPLVREGADAQGAPDRAGYIEALLQARDIDTLIADRPAPDAADRATSLLHLLLRHALLRELALAAARLIAEDTGADVLSLLRDPELIDLVDGAAPTFHWLRQLDAPLAGAGGRRVGEILFDPASAGHPALAALGELRAALADLAGLDTETLQRAMQSTLDLSAHRLDAWITSLPTRRLAAMRAERPSGQYVGAYGWVENLVPAPAGRRVDVDPTSVGAVDPLQAPAGDSGFIHAPSLSQAAAAALLRNAHLGASGTPGPADPFAIELTSRRVREAGHLLDGVREGQPLGALLGYRLERRLHESRIGGLTLDRFVAPLRRLAPLSGAAGSAAPAESIAANNVVDGFALGQRWRDDRASVLAALAVTQGSPEHVALSAALDALAAAIDGLADALTAEAAYQLVQGGTARLGATLAAVADGSAPAPELQVARTPRSGRSQTHRLLLLISGTSNLDTPGWLAGNTGIRSRAERLLNYWAGRLFGDARRIRCTVEALGPGGEVLAVRGWPLGELALTPLDLLHGVEVDEDIHAEPPEGELEQRVLYHAARLGVGIEPVPRLRLRHARPLDLAVDEITLLDALEQARTLRRLLVKARGLRPGDLLPPHQPAGGTLDLADLEARAILAEDGINAAHQELVRLVGAGATTAEALRASLLRLSAYGIAGAIPISAVGEDAEAAAGLRLQARTVSRRSAERLQQSQGLRTQPAIADPEARCRQLAQRLQAVFGAGFVVLPRFRLDASRAAEISAALAAGPQAQGGDSLAAATWLARQARVRDGAAQLAGCLRGAEVLGTGTRLALSVAQLPFVAGERWIGLPDAEGQPTPAGKLSLVVQTARPLAMSEVLGGLLVDEWTEIVPSPEETTGIAFQLDTPGACPPQGILIAVPPVAGQPWTTEALRQVLMETLDLAKLRAVDPALLGQAAQYLPALLVAFNTADHVVSTDFSPLAA